MATTGDIAEFVQSLDYGDLSEEVREAVKKRVLDAIGIGLGAIGEPPVESVRETVREINTDGACTLWGTDATASPPEAAMVNTALIRYLDYMDSILLPGETPHPTDNIGAAVAAGEYHDRSGEDLITSVAIAYEVQGELAAKAPGRDLGWDHPHIIFSSTAAVCKLIHLDYDRTCNAIGIAAAEYVPLSVIRRGQISMWKGLASANRARNAVYTAMLVNNGVEGPVDAIDGEGGWEQQIQGREFHLDFTPGERVLEVMTKRYMAGTHAQAAIEGVLELIESEGIVPGQIAHIHLDTYESAKRVMGERPTPEDRQTADHSTHYILAVAALDGQVMQEQYTEERILSDDVQDLFRNITIGEKPELTRRYNEKGEQPYDITITTEDGNEHYIEKRVFQGHPMNPMTWDQLTEKFNRIAADVYDESRRDEIVDLVKNLENHQMTDLTSLLNSS